MPESPTASAKPSKRELAVVLAGGFMLAAVAGYINTVVIALGAPAVTHLTGTISRLSSDLGRSDFVDARSVASLALAFVIGAALSGVILGSARLHLGRRYGVALLFESVLLAAATIAITESLFAGALLAAAAAGLQNAMASSYRSLILRTTHVTGTLTDLGFLAGQRLSGHRIESWRFAMLGLLLASFVGGGVLGYLAFARHGHTAMWIPTSLLAIVGSVYFVLNALHRRASA